MLEKQIQFAVFFIHSLRSLRTSVGILCRNDHVDAWVEEYKKSFDIVLMVKEKFQTFQRLDSVLFYRIDLFVFPE